MRTARIRHGFSATGRFNFSEVFTDADGRRL
jgi:hypothetical protein